MKSKIFTQEEIDDAKALATEEFERAHQGNYKVHFDSQNWWMGKLGEAAFAELYPRFRRHTKDFEVLKFDFLTPKNEKLETKTSSGKFEWRDGFAVAVEGDQYNDGNYQILVFCYFYPPKVTIVGWNYFEAFEAHESKRFYEKGEDVFTYNDRFMFNCQSNGGTYTWRSDVLRPMEKLEELYP